MTDTLHSMLDLWQTALSHEERREDAIALLADACAFGLNEGDFQIEPIIEQLRDTFTTLHVAKHVGRLS